MNTQLRDYLLLFVACVLFHVLGTWNVPLIDRDEPRFAEASREMRERQDYIVPYFNNQYRFDKPPLTYWAQVASFTVFGENDFAARFPSTIAAALTALVIFACGSRMSGRTTGFWAAVMFTLSLQTFLHAKAAVADMWLVLFMTVAGWAGYELRGQRQTPNAQRSAFNAQLSASSVWWWVFYTALALAFLAKGPIGLLPLIPLIWIKLQSPRKAFYFSLGAGLLLTLGVICVWAVPALIQTQGEFWRVGIGRHVIGRSVGAMEGHGGNSVEIYLLLLPFYFVTVFGTFYPWSLNLPWLIANLRRERNHLDRYLVAGIGAIFIVFTLVATKLPHYILPAFPLLALLLAREISLLPFQRPFAVTAAGSCFVIPIVVSFIGWLIASLIGWILAGICLVIFVAVFVVVFLPRVLSIRFAGALAVFTTIVFLALGVFAPPLLAYFSPSRELFRQTKDFLKPGTEFGAVDYIEPSLVWYFRSRTREFLKPLRRKNLAEFMAQPGSRFVVVPTSIAASAVTNSPDKLKIFSAHGFNIAKGQKVDLTLVLKPE